MADLHQYLVTAGASYVRQRRNQQEVPYCHRADQHSAAVRLCLAAPGNATVQRIAGMYLSNGPVAELILFTRNPGVENVPEIFADVAASRWRYEGQRVTARCRKLRRRLRRSSAI